ncbi:hypothetical protein [Chryseobacterium herbae]|uniref:Lipoprotein n=1 Tax=Chryseobacterium herbae TaxID=2976476 RepID=A0ABT2IP93_9FLAO|nr:hypothetical protein [Chryseobacterium sp. pc1-10]MCT2560351.1 hypothetical protein [Chryseobacterium sp. pc1-10]
MKKVITFLTFITLVTACNKKINTDRIENVTIIDSSDLNKKEAVIILNEVQGWMEKGVSKKLSPSKVNEKINPLMDKYQNLLKNMNKHDSMEIQDYRIMLINKLIDFKIKQTKE